MDFNPQLQLAGLLEWMDAQLKACHGRTAVIGISGGKDSSTVAALAAAAYGREHVFGVLMPDGVQPDIDYSQALVEHLQIPHCTINIHDAVQGVLKEMERAGLTLADLTLIDMHEAFAAQTLANLQCLASERFAREVLGRSQATGEVDESKFNVLGGSIAYGHPFAAGARMITQTLHELRRRGGGFGLVTACAAGGLGAAMIVEAE
mgnify:CR=1 FL=1